MQELNYVEGHVTTCKPKTITPSQDKVAIVLHLFYPDLWAEIQSYLKNLNIGYDLFVTVPYSVEDREIIDVFKDQPSVKLYKTGNRGRDVLPFLQVMNIIGLNNYKYICKLHSKKTANSPLGSVWRKLLYFDLIGSNKIVEDTL
jgi:lipopolysaccharide biosynthesis protein